MKVGDKYIIEIEEVIRRNGAPQIARVKGFNALVFDKYGLEKLEPYDGDKVYRKGYVDGINAVMNESEKKNHSDLDYRDGLEDGRMEAWECARKLCQSEKYGGLEEHCAEIFNRQDTFDVFDYSASEAIARMKEYEQTDEMSMKDAISTLKYQYDNGQMEQDVHKALGMAIKSMEYIDDHAL